jgi:hypothetical protein
MSTEKCKMCNSDMQIRIVGISYKNNNLKDLTEEKIKKMYRNNYILACTNCVYAVTIDGEI